MHLPKQLAHEVRSWPRPLLPVTAKLMSKVGGGVRLWDQMAPVKPFLQQDCVLHEGGCLYPKRGYQVPCRAWIHRGSGSFVSFLLIHVHQHLCTQEEVIAASLSSQCHCLFVCLPPPRLCTHTYMSHSCIEGQRITGVEEPVLSFYHVDPKDGTQAVGLSSSTSTPSHRAGPAAGFSSPGLHW